MRVTRFNQPFHYSDIETYQRCPKSFYFQNILNLQRKYISWKAVMGKAIKAVIYHIHKKKTYFPDPEKLYNLLTKEYECVCQNLLKKGIAVQETSNVHFTPYIEMLRGYIRKEENREAKIICSKANFRFSIKPFTTIYHFTGSIDQLRKNKDGTFELIVFKSGRKFDHRPYELFMNYQLSIYAYALYQGEVYTDKSSFHWQRPQIIPDYVSLYLLQDHYPYRRNCNKKDKKGNIIKCRSGEERGPAIYRSTRSRKRLRYIPLELGRICAAIRRSEYFARPNFLCENHCNFRDYCQAAITYSIK